MSDVTIHTQFRSTAAIPVFARRLSLAEDELVALRPRVGLISDYERQIRRLRDDIAVLTGHRSTLTTW